MRNKLIFLGTAGDSLTLAKQRRQGGGFILNLEGSQYHIDPGPGALAAAVAAHVSPRETIAVLVSNNSLLASGGVNEVIDAMTLGGIDRFGVVVCATSINQGTEDEQPILRKGAAAWVERVVNFEGTTRVGINYLNVFPKRAYASDPSAIGFRLETASLTVGYTGDTGYTPGVADQHRGVDVLIVRCKHPQGIEEKGALNVSEVMQLLEKARPRVCFLTGFGNKLLDMDLISVARDIQRDTKVRTIAAKDGLEVDLDEYAGKTSQTVLAEE